MSPEMFNGVGDAIVATFRVMTLFLFVSVPLAIWKVIDIAVWLFNHISISWD